MSYDLYAHVCVPKFTTDEDDAPQFLYPLSDYRRVFVANYSYKLLAQWWGINLKRVWLDPEKTMLVPAVHIHRYEIVEIP